MNKAEIYNQVYDKLMDNWWEKHDNFDVDRVKNQEVNLDNGVITFDYNGNKVILEVQVK